MNSFEIREIESKIVAMINEIPLPLEVKRLMMLEIMQKIELAAKQEIDAQVTEREAQEAKAKELSKEGEKDA